MKKKIARSSRSALSAACIAATALSGALGLPQAAVAQSTAASAPSVVAQPTMRIRGTIVEVDATTLVVKDRRGETLRLARAEKMPVSEVFPIALTDIKQGSFVGAAAMPQPDGKQKALEVLVFPEAARGSGEGHHPWDLQQESTMTNATVAELAPAPASVMPGGQELKLTYKGGEKTVIVPPDVPIVSFKPADDLLLVPGAKVLVTAQDKNGTPTALRVLTGRNGFAPPM